MVSDSLRPQWAVAYQVPPSVGLFSQEYRSGLPFPSPGDLPDQGLKPGLPRCRQMLYHLSYQRSRKEESETARKFEEERTAVTCHGKEGVLEILLTAPIASLFTQSTLLTEPGVGNVRSKSLEGDSRSHRNCTYFYSLLAGMAAITHILSPGWRSSQSSGCNITIM